MMKGTLEIFKEDYQLMKNSYGSLLTKQLSKDSIMTNVGQPLSQSEQTQTEGSNVELELASLFISHEYELYTINEALIK